MNIWEIADADDLRAALLAYLSRCFERFALAPPTYSGTGDLFSQLLSSLAARAGKTVVLIDEYDYPILHNLDNPALPEIQNALSSFYGVLKAHDADAIRLHHRHYPFCPHDPLLRPEQPV